MKTQAKPKLKLTKRARKEELQFFAYISPWIIGFLLFTVVPLLSSVLFAFFDFTKVDLAMGNPLKFVGFRNFSDILLGKDSHFWQAVGNTFFYAFVRVFVGFAISFIFAVLLNRDLKLKKLFRVLVYVPAIIPMVGSALVWRGLFDERFSFFNYLLNYIGIPPVAWATDNAMGSVLLMSIWCGIGPTMIIILASLQNVPQELLEAADIDGANVWHKYTKIVLPLISPTVLYILVTGFIGCLQAYAEFDLVTGGGPGYDTTTMSMLVINAMNDGYGLGYACALAWLICIIVMIFTFVFFKVSQGKVYYEEDNEN